MDGMAGGGNVLILVMPFHHLHVLRQLHGAAQPHTPRWHPRWHVPMDPCHRASCSSGKALLPTQVARITAAPWSAGSHRLCGCHLQLENKSLEQVRNYSPEVLGLPGHLQGKRKGQTIKLEGRKCGKMEFCDSGGEQLL